MKVVFSVVGTTERYDNVTVELDAVPREGESVSLPGLESEYESVRSVTWFPLGDQEESPGSTEPFVYVVLGPPRPR